MNTLFKHCRQALHEALLAGCAGCLVFLPLTGVVLDGYGFHLHWQRAFILIGAVMLGRGLFSLCRQCKAHRPSQPTPKLTSEAPATAFPWNHTITAVLIVSGVILPWLIGKYWLTVCILALIYVLLGLGLNIVVGLAGLLDLGFVAFYAVGAYTYALSYHYFGFGFWQALPLSMLVAASFGVLLGFPVLRLHGDYLAIVTLGFGEIIRLILNNWVAFTGGPSGLFAPAPMLFGLEFTRRARHGMMPFHRFFNIPYSSYERYLFTYALLFLCVLTVVFVITRLKRMPIGRAWEALREDEIACRSLGINHVTSKLAAFCIGAMIGGVAGVFFAGFQRFIDPTSFTFIESALILSIVVLGGMGSTLGVIFAAFFFTLLPEVLREFSNFRILIFGILMIVIMIWRPNGLVRNRRRIFSLPKPS